MKAVKVLFLALVMVAAMNVANAGDKSTCVSVLSIKRDIFYFKVANNLTGAAIEVYSSTGELIYNDTITHHKTLIDFYFEQPGTFTIKIIKGSHTESFNYEKTSPSPYQDAAEGAEHHVIVGK
ncbi:hypothetical protein [Chryseolinea lacunae]|uniref:Uncharacterized protein n=1 Tax=Chryseolinea lacunae TaxID=2801331 RepID=A0ABS1KLA8_9BACT|nr:hypothetical protein [Chryseolinea lacunae]MBL0740246.1 hypothetical protein [Chryseolinea lacunae]